MDAAAIVLDKPVPWDRYPHIRPICLPPRGNIENYVNSSAMVSGWGITTTGRASQVLRKGQVMVLPPEQCSNAKVYGEKFTSNMLCAGTEDSSVNVCTGDSGGPLGKQPERVICSSGN